MPLRNSVAKTQRQRPPSPGLMQLLKPYRWLIAILVALTIVGNGLNLVVPKLISRAIDDYTQGRFVLTTVVVEFLVVGLLVFLFLLTRRAVVQTWASERVAKDLRTRLAAKISVQSFAWVERITPAKLLTNLTSDVDAREAVRVAGHRVHHFFAVPDCRGERTAALHQLAAGARRSWASFRSSRLRFNWCCAKSARSSRESQEAIDWLNRVINESILGASLIRLLNTQQIEYQKFMPANTEARDIGLSILRLFASLIPAITLATNVATVIILALGGHFVIAGSMSLGDFTAFNSYLAHPDLPHHSHRIHEQRHCAGLRLLHADWRRLERSRRRKRGGNLVADLRGDVAWTMSRSPSATRWY